MSYKVAITIGEFEQTDRRAAVEGAYMDILLHLIHGGCEFEVTDTNTGETSIIQLEPELENDQTMLRHWALIQIASTFMTAEQKTELEKWEKENLDGHSVATSDWPGWDKIIGQPKPRKLRFAFVEDSENSNGSRH